MKNSWISEKRVVVTFSVLFCLAQAKWISFKQNEVNQSPDVTVVSSSEVIVNLNFNIKVFETEIINTK